MVVFSRLRGVEVGLLGLTYDDDRSEGFGWSYNGEHFIVGKLLCRLCVFGWFNEVDE